MAIHAVIERHEDEEEREERWRSLQHGVDVDEVHRGAVDQDDLDGLDEGQRNHEGIDLLEAVDGALGALLCG